MTYTPRRSYLEEVDELYVAEKYLEWSKGDYALVAILAFISTVMMSPFVAIDFYDSWYFYMGVGLFTSNFVFGTYKFIKYRKFKRRAEILRVLGS